MGKLFHEALDQKDNLLGIINALQQRHLDEYGTR